MERHAGAPHLSDMVFPHRIFVEWSEAKGCFVAHVSAMPGAPAYGATPEEAVRMLFGADHVVMELAEMKEGSG